MINDTMAQMRPTMALSGMAAIPVIPERVMTGIPIDPNATGAVLASRQIPAA